MRRLIAGALLAAAIGCAAGGYCRPGAADVSPGRKLIITPDPVFEEADYWRAELRDAVES
jgi:hypothetical protein